uniref:Putative similar to chymotrypsin-elastase inhibitor ixodidin n=1 Tax=Rhipicephalus pulchellus TaxID=72859 RepID=L7LQP6_RHIPC
MIVLLVLVVCATLVQVNGQLHLASLPSTKPDKYLGVCPLGQVYKTCESGTCGENKCYQLTTGSRACTFDCVTGCFCEKGLYRNEEGHCVLWFNCPMFQ